MQDTGLYICRGDWIWHKTNGMPASVNDRLNESEDLDWIINTNPSFKNKIIKFEPLITEDEYNVVLNTLLNSGEGLYCSQGGIETLEPFLAYKYLHTIS